MLYNEGKAIGCLISGGNMDTLVDSSRLLNEKETADMLGISVKTLQKWRYLGIGVPFVKVGRLVRYKIECILEYLRKNEVGLR